MFSYLGGIGAVCAEKILAQGHNPLKKQAAGGSIRTQGLHALGNVSALHVNHIKLLCRRPNTTTKWTRVCVQGLSYTVNIYSLRKSKESPVLQLIQNKDSARLRFLLIGGMLETFSFQNCQKHTEILIKKKKSMIPISTIKTLKSIFLIYLKKYKQRKFTCGFKP